MSNNTSPKRNGKPTIFFSFGGQSQGGAVWDTIFSSASSATLYLKSIELSDSDDPHFRLIAIRFGQNAAALVTTVYKTVGQSAYVGFDLDVEETATTLPYIGKYPRLIGF